MFFKLRFGKLVNVGDYGRQPNCRENSGRFGSANPVPRFYAKWKVPCCRNSRWLAWLFHKAVGDL